MNWYVVRAISGKENKVKNYIETEISRLGLGEFVEEVLVPTEKVVQIRNGKKINKERVYFSGYIADPAPFYNISDIILVPSEKPEPFGRVAVEAMSCSKLVIASNHGGLASIIDNDENGILFEPNDLHDLVKALTKAIEEKSHCSELAKNGYKKYLSQYTSEICYKKYLKYYERFNCFRN